MKVFNMILKPFYELRKTIYKLKRSCRWFVRTWNNYDWEYDYLIQMMVSKMEDMRYQFDVTDKNFIDLRHQPISFNEENTDTEDNLKGLDEAIEIGKRIIRNDYIEYTPDVEKWFETHSFLEGDEMPDSLRKEWENYNRIAEKKEQDDRKNFFNIIRDEHQKWWD